MSKQPEPPAEPPTAVSDRAAERASGLRKQAEQMAGGQSGQVPLEALLPVETQAALHELRVHQIELEMQNEELRGVQAALEESRDHYSDLYEHAPVGYVTLTGAGLIAEINLTGSAMLGAGRASLVQRGFSRFVVAEDQDAWHRHFARGLRDGEAQGRQTCELRLRRADGTVIDVNLESVPVMVGGAAAGGGQARAAAALRIALSDITERKRAEKELTALRAGMRQMLVWQVASKTVAALAHEVNQPLASLSALCEAASRVLATDAAAGRAGQLGEILQRMAAESERAGAVVRRLMESLRQPQTGSQADTQAGLQPIALAALLQETARLAQSGGFPDCNVVIDCPADMRPVRGDRVQLEKALLNLIGNSAQAMREANRPGGRIAISVERADEGARVTVRDQGPGVSAGMQGQLFQPFVTTKRGGMGMGLAISRTLIEAHGGRLWYDAAEGPGATFRFTLPLVV